jgi:peptidoglycan/xylan/chitin deacetylase (PgdA/CDA1 family)
MVKAAKSPGKKVSKKKIHFLPPSSQYRFPLPLLIFISLSFFLLLIGVIIFMSQQSKETQYAFSPETTTQKINQYENEFIKKVRAESLTTLPHTSGYCLTVPILMYHHVQPLAEATKLGYAPLTVDKDVFERQLAYLIEQRYTTITLDSLVEALQNHKKIPERSIVLTFDDGYFDMYTYVFPLLKQYNLTGNFMISTGLLGNTDYMKWSQVKEMSNDSHVSLYNHTWSHNAVGQSDKERIDFELEMSTQDFVNNIGHMSTVFAYPYGSYSNLAIKELKAHGFTAAVTTEAGRLQCESTLMTLKRDHISNVPLSAYGL